MERVRIQSSTQPATLRQCREILEQIAKDLSYQDTNYLLQRFGVAKVKDVPRECYSDFVALGEAVLKFKVSPAEGWNGDNTPVLYTRERKILRR